MENNYKETKDIFSKPLMIASDVNSKIFWLEMGFTAIVFFLLWKFPLQIVGAGAFPFLSTKEKLILIHIIILVVVLSFLTYILNIFKEE